MAPSLTTKLLRISNLLFQFQLLNSTRIRIFFFGSRQPARSFQGGRFFTSFEQPTFFLSGRCIYHDDHTLNTKLLSPRTFSSSLTFVPACQQTDSAHKHNDTRVPASYTHKYNHRAIVASACVTHSRRSVPRFTALIRVQSRRFWSPHAR